MGSASAARSSISVIRPHIDVLWVVVSAPSYKPRYIPFPNENIKDEVNFGSCARCRERLTESKRWEIFAEHVEKVREVMAGHGKKMMMWGDHLTSEPELADRLPKDIVVCDWQYFDVDASAVAGLLDRGFEVICCPALINAFKVIHPRESNLQNIKDFTGIAIENTSKGVTGLMNTVWCPYRYLQGAVVHGIALAEACSRMTAGNRRTSAKNSRETTSV